MARAVALFGQDNTFCLPKLWTMCQENHWCILRDEKRGSVMPAHILNPKKKEN